MDIYIGELSKRTEKRPSVVESFSEFWRAQIIAICRLCKFVISAILSVLYGP